LNASNSGGYNLSSQITYINVSTSVPPTPTPTTTTPTPTPTVTTTVTTVTPTPTPTAPINSLNLTVTNYTQSSVTWTWDTGKNVTSVIVDGQAVNLTNSSIAKYTLYNVKASTYHTIEVTTNETTADSAGSTANDAATILLLYITTYIWAIAAIIMIMIGLSSRNQIWSMLCLLLVAPFISLYGLATFIQSEGILITDIWHLPFFVYAALFIVSLVLWATLKRRS
jgi:hypothetical protein